MKIILESPVASEKAQDLKEKRNTYTFRVASRANKVEIAEAIESMFGVKPVLVRTVAVSGKKLPLNKWRKLQYRPSWKKAYITLKKGEKIKELE